MISCELRIVDDRSEIRDCYWLMSSVSYESLGERHDMRPPEAARVASWSVVVVVTGRVVSFFGIERAI